jgi:FkbM family methyltransferase
MAVHLLQAARMNRFVSKWMPSKIKFWLKLILQKGFREKVYEEKRLRSLPRYVRTETFCLGRKIAIVDAPSFLASRSEIFGAEIYKFRSDRKSPYIIDCGSNIGLSIIHFKTLYPDAKIVGFEADKKVFDVLTHNIDAFKLENVALFNNAIWHEETVLHFFSEGADGGRIDEGDNTGRTNRIQAIRLGRFMNEPVDLLKMDIEGAEYEVLNDCKDLLKNVQNIFVEYHSLIKEEQRLQRILEILTQAGFRYYLDRTGIESPRPFYSGINVFLGIENQVNIYGYRDARYNEIPMT